jgi:hypothetical protein
MLLLILNHTLNRSITLENIKLGDIDETNAFTYLNSEFKFGKLTINPAVRLDYFKFNYRDKLAPIYKTQTESEVKVSKLNFIYSQNNNLQFFCKVGIGFQMILELLFKIMGNKFYYRDRNWCRNDLETFPRLINCELSIICIYNKSLSMWVMQESLNLAEKQEEWELI